MHRKPVILDLFCGAGGASVGYHRAGFDVVGVDISKFALRYYPFYSFWNGAESFMDYWLEHRHIKINAIHASPPCQAYSVANYITKYENHPRLIEPIRKRLEESGLPYVIENVPGAPLIEPVMVCGSAFDELSIPNTDGISALRRHRLFEVNWPAKGTECYHKRQTLRFPSRRRDGRRRGSVITVIGRGNNYGKKEMHYYSHAMGIHWMRKVHLTEAIPPAYTEYLGRQLNAHIQKGSSI